MNRFVIAALLPAVQACSSPSGPSSEAANVAGPTAMKRQVPMPELTVDGLRMKLSSPYTDAFCDVVGRIRNTGTVPVQTPDFTVQYELNGDFVTAETELLEQDIALGGMAALKMKHYCPPKGSVISDLTAVSFFDKRPIRIFIKKKGG